MSETVKFSDFYFEIQKSEENQKCSPWKIGVRKWPSHPPEMIFLNIKMPPEGWKVGNFHYF